MKKIICLLLSVLLLGAIFTACDNALLGDLGGSSAGSSLSLGKIQDGTYTNSYAGFGCKLEAPWYYYSDEQLDGLPEDVRNTLEGTQLGEIVDKYTQFTEMMAQNEDELCTLNVLYQKVDTATRLLYAGKSEEWILDQVLTTKDQMIEAYAQSGMKVKSIEKVKVNFLGQERYALRTEGSIDGVAMYLVQLIDYSLGQWSVTLTVSSQQYDKTADMLALFYPVD